MKKRLAVVTCIVLLMAAFAAAAFADSPIKLIINGRIIESNPAPYLVNGRTMVPLRWVAEGLGASVQWDEKSRSVSIDIPQSASLQRQVDLLQASLAPATPREAAEKWAQGLKTRNGALQFAVMSPELKERTRSDYENINWVTGTSSPWIEKYEITGGDKGEDGSFQFEIKCELAASTGPAGTSVNTVAVRQYDSAYYITKIFSDDSVAEQLEKQVRDYLNGKYGTHYQVTDIKIDRVSGQITDSGAEAVFLTKVIHGPLYKTAGQWPSQKGRIRYLEENRAGLTDDQIRLIQEKINFWNKELQQYIDNPGEANEFLKVTADLEYYGLIKNETVKLFYEDPMGKYLPVIEEDWPAFKTAEELEKQGYEEMRQLINK